MNVQHQKQFLEHAKSSTNVCEMNEGSVLDIVLRILYMLAHLKLEVVSGISILKIQETKIWRSSMTWPRSYRC